MGKGLLGILARPKRRAQALPSSEDLLRLLSEQVPAIVWTTDRRLRICSAWGRALAEPGLEPWPLVGLHVGECFAAESPEASPLQAHREALNGLFTSFPFRWAHHPYQAYVGPRSDGQDRISGVLGMALDTTEQQQAEQAQLESEQRYRQLFEEALDVIFALDLDGHITSLNKAARRVSGYRRDELIGSNVSRLLEPAAYQYVNQLIQRALGGETTAQLELPIVARDGRRVVLDVNARLQFENGRPVGIQGIARDITERRRMEERLLEAQKLEALEELAGGVAHDLNNSLAIILGHAGLLKLNREAGDAVREAAEVIERAAERARQLTAPLLGFAGRENKRTVAVDLHALLEEVLGLLKPTLPKNIALIARYDADHAVIIGNPAQMCQLFLNLARNLRDAMPEGGTMVFRTERVEVSAEATREFGVRSPGWYVKISVNGTGVPIPAADLPPLFETSAASKSTQAGRDMGLTMAYLMAKNYGGTIETASQPGCGTTFSVYFPAPPVEAELPSCPAPGQAESPSPPAAGGPASHSPSILVIDDEETVGRAAACMLERLGYRATVADPQRALEMFGAAPRTFDLVLLDALMPGMTGEACFQVLKAIRPDVRVMITSGKARERAVQEMLDSGALGFLPKPYSFGQLAEAVGKALGV